MVERRQVEIFFWVEDCSSISLSGKGWFLNFLVDSEVGFWLLQSSVNCKGSWRREYISEWKVLDRKWNSLDIFVISAWKFAAFGKFLSIAVQRDPRPQSLRKRLLRGDGAEERGD